MAGLVASGLAVVRDGRPVLVDVDVSVGPGKSLAVVGASGAGKTTLLDVLCGLLLPDAGTVRVGDVEVTDLAVKPRAKWRLHSCGVVFQFAELLPELTLQENVELPLRLLGIREDAGRRARAVLEELDIAHLADRTHVDANVGGLIGGSDQVYLRMQEWLRAGLLLLLITMGAVILLAAAHDVRDRVGLRWALHALGAGRGPFLAALRRELVIRNLALFGVTGMAAGVAAYAATGWVSADPIPGGWLALIYGSLLALATLATLVPLLVAAFLRPRRASDDGSALTHRPL